MIGGEGIKIRGEFKREWAYVLCCMEGKGGVPAGSAGGREYFKKREKRENYDSMEKTLLLAFRERRGEERRKIRAFKFCPLLSKGKKGDSRIKTKEGGRLRRDRAFLCEGRGEREGRRRRVVIKKKGGVR